MSEEFIVAVPIALAFVLAIWAGIQKYEAAHRWTIRPHRMGDGSPGLRIIVRSPFGPVVQNEVLPVAPCYAQPEARALAQRLHRVVSAQPGGFLDAPEDLPVRIAGDANVMLHHMLFDGLTLDQRRGMPRLTAWLDSKENTA